MKNILKRSISILLAVTIIFSSAYVGINELDFSGVFVVDAKAVSSGKCGNQVNWKFDNNGVLTISGTGAMFDYEFYEDYTDTEIPWGSFLSLIKRVVIESGVTSISDGAFRGCTNLTSVTIGNDLTRVSSYAFGFCKSLTSITIPNSVTSIGNYAFEDCKSLTSITIPRSVTSIGAAAFDSCRSLSGVYITDIAAWCNISFKYTNYEETSNYTSNPLYYAGNLYINGRLATNIVIPKGVEHIRSYAFYNCDSIRSITIPDSVTDIGTEVFSGCTSLTSITLPGSVEFIHFAAFKNCTNLESVYITDLAAWCNMYFDYDYENEYDEECFSFYANPFCYASKLYVNGKLATDIVLPEGVEKINSYAFMNCTSLTSITIPDGVTSIGDGAFKNCTGLASVSIGDSITSVGEEAFYNTQFYNNERNWVNGVLYVSNHIIEVKESISGNYIIKPGTKTIPASAFSNCRNLTAITIPDSITSIGEYAFYNCQSLKSVYITDLIAWCNIEFENYTSNPLYYAHKLYINDKLATNVIIPKGATRIGDYAFQECENIISITIPDGVTNIGDSAFAGCCNLTKLTIPDSVTSIGDYAFSGSGYYNDEKNWKNGVFYIKSFLLAAKSSLSGRCIIKAGTKTIANSAFRGCSGLTSIIIPDSVTSIGKMAFSNCKNLKSVVIPDSVTSIGEKAFLSCNSLKSVAIPDTVTNIGIEAFGCYVEILEDITEEEVIYSNENFKIYGKKGSAAERYAKDWGLKFIECEHQTTKWVTEKEASVKAAGSKRKECTKCGSILGIATIPQLKPGRVTLTKATNTSKGVKISWKKVSGATEYVVYRKSGNGDYKKIGTTTSTSYTDKTAKSGTKYRYNVKAKNPGGTSSLSKKGLNKLFLATPKVKVSNGTSAINVKWNKITGAKGYYVYRKVGSGEYKKVATMKKSTTLSYTDKNVTSGKKYSYKVVAYNGDYRSSSIATNALERLKAPTLKSVSSGKSGITLKWSKSTGADGYYVYRKTGSGSYSRIATVKGNAKVSYLDKSAKKGKTYTYKVKAYSGKSISARSKTVKIKDKY